MKEPGLAPGREGAPVILTTAPCTAIETAGSGTLAVPIPARPGPVAIIEPATGIGATRRCPLRLPAPWVALPHQPSGVILLNPDGVNGACPRSRLPVAR